MMSSLQQINQKLLKLNEQYEKLFNNNQYKSPLLNRKSFSLLMQTIYIYIENGPNQTNQVNKRLFLTLITSYIKNFLNSHIFLPLSKSNNYQQFQDTLAEKWKNFKLFTFCYFALLQSANNYYETTFLCSVQSGVKIDMNSQNNIFPIPVMALILFKKIIYSQFQDKIQNIVLQSIKNYRMNTKHKTENLKNILQMIWSCGLGQLARISIIPGRGANFYKQQKTAFVSSMKFHVNTDDFFKQKVLDKILEDTQTHYTQEYSNKIRILYPFQQIKAIKAILQKEYQFCEQFLLTKKSQQLYMGKVQTPLTVNLEERLRAAGSLKTLIQNYKFSSQDGFSDIGVYFDLIKSVSKTSDKRTRVILKIFESIITQVISQHGKQINQKINKRRQHISQMLTLKKSIDKIIDQLGNKNILLVSAKEKAFKKILDSIQASRNLADFTDFTIRQCIRLKLDEERSLQKFADVFILLNVITSTDSFLLYHQESMAKRVIQSLNQPKLQYELLMLKKLSQRMGVMTVSSHMSMIKDMQTSQQLTQKYNNRLPFSSFKWSLKIFNPSFWPQNINREKLSIQIPNYVLHQAKAIQDLYHSQNQYRYLNWKLEKGTSLFQGRFETKKVRFQSENSYLMILLLIAEQPQNKIIYGNLKQFVRSQKNNHKLDNQSKNDPLAMLLYVLIENRLILRKNVENKYAPFSESQELQINKSYTPPEMMNKGQQVVIIRPSQQMAKNLQQSSIEKNKIMKDREKLIEAVLVKVLKHSHATKDNSVTFPQLYQAIRDHHILGGFNFSQGIVKQRLQELIAREYCVRDEDDRKIYHYVA